MSVDSGYSFKNPFFDLFRFFFATAALDFMIRTWKYEMRAIVIIHGMYVHILRKST